MTTQSEQTLENNLITQLQQLGYEKVLVTDDKQLVANFRVQLQRLNAALLTDHEFTQILNFINKGNIFNRAKILRDRVPYVDADGQTRTVQLLDGLNQDANIMQVTQQVRMEGRYKTRYDVTLMINGLPLVQIELKRRGLEVKEAFNQINRYEKHSYWAGHGLFQFVQIFVISNGVNTKYFANNAIRSRNFKQTFYWTDIKNKLITQLTDFSDVFLNPAHLLRMISQYIVLNESQKMLMVLRPYQYYATEAIVNQVKTSDNYGYIWHTTGSGKTLTSFKTAQILTRLPKVHKVMFVVDRKDLDYQTSKEFNSFAKGNIDATSNTMTLVKQMVDDTPLIVTTIQKLNTAISKSKYLAQLDGLKDEKIVFIFDECHRSQFGETHGKIKDFFTQCQMFGFTGTPIFEENAGVNQYGKRTTSMLFGKPLHKYVITDAIRDENVLKFSIEYINTFKRKDNIIDIKVEDIDEEDKGAKGLGEMDIALDFMDEDEQTFEDFKSKYLDLYEKAKHNTDKDKVSILEDIDFELELIHRDEINVTYIINLLKGYNDLDTDEQEKQKAKILESMQGELELRSKRELIEKFISKQLPLLADADSVPDAFEIYWEKAKQRALKDFSKAENLDQKRLDSVIEDYIYTDRKPLRDDVISMMEQKPKLAERSTTAERLIQKVTHYVDTFISGMGM